MSALLNKKAASRRGRSTIRTRVLAIAFVPSIVFLLAGAVVAGYLIYDAIRVRTFATEVHDSAEPAGRFFALVREERRLTLQELADSRSLRTELERLRAQTDAAAARQAEHLESMLDDAPANVRDSITATAAQVAKLPDFRERVDSGDVTLQQAYDFYNKVIDQYTIGLNGVAQATPSAETAYKRLIAMPLFTSADAMSRGDALVSAGIAGSGLTEQEFRTYIGQVGAYHASLRQAVPEMIPPVRQQYEQLVNSEAWNTLRTVENAFLRGNQTDLPVPESEWREAARQVSDTLWNLYVQQSSEATNLALDEADKTLITSIIAGAAVLLVALAVFLVAWRLSNRLVKRLTSLREQTLDIADERMPKLVERVRGGDQVDLTTEVSYLDHGDDEIGQVADAFNKAQQTAIAAAVDEAKTREGTKRVFLNIAHRSQVIVHRQLQALDAAERKQEDPDQLDMLFRLDHLSTRARRNAENLIILGGEQPGRQFRNPVAVSDLVRGATAETEEYKRVSMGKLPATAVAGPVVGDLVHLLAELIDNATSFSPPQSRVEVRGELVGRGAVIEIEDQGIGMESEQLEHLNEMLRTPPDFSFMALSDEPRLGLFVVARLAAKHGLTVTLRESAYGGTRAIVLVRSDLLSEVPDAEDVPPKDHTREQSAPVTSRRPRTLPKTPAVQVNGTHGANGVARTGADAGHADGAHTARNGSPTVTRSAAGSHPRLNELSDQHSEDTPESGTQQSGRQTRAGQRPPQPHREAGRNAEADTQYPAPPQSETPPQYAPRLPREAPGQREPQPQHGARHRQGAGTAPDGRAAQRNRPPDTRPATPAAPGASATQAAASAQGAVPQASGQDPMPPDRPPLPRRRRQQNLAPQLMEEAAVVDQPDASEGEGREVEKTPEQARNRLSAFQQGTRRARENQSGRDDSGD